MPDKIYPKHYSCDKKIWTHYNSEGLSMSERLQRSFENFDIDKIKIEAKLFKEFKPKTKKETKMKIEAVVLIDGNQESNYSNHDIIVMITNLQDANDGLKNTGIGSKTTAAMITLNEGNIKKLVEVLDSREVD